MKCKRCNDEKNQIKAGKTKSGSQKYKCKVCGKVYTPNLKKRSYSEEVKKTGDKIAYGGKQRTSSRQNFRNREKYVLVLDTQICQNNKRKRSGK